MPIFLLVLAAAAFATGGLFMKYSEGLTRLVPSVLVFLLFAFGAACQAKAMLRMEMGVTYVVVLGFEALTASLLSVVVLHERMNGMRALAVVVIVFGMALLQRS